MNTPEALDSSWGRGCWCWWKDSNWSGILAYKQHIQNGTYAICVLSKRARPNTQYWILLLSLYLRFTKQSLVVFITTHINVDFRLVLALHLAPQGRVAAMNSMKPLFDYLSNRNPNNPKPNFPWLKREISIFSLNPTPQRNNLERFLLLPSIEAVITPKNMLPWSSKRMARAELLCTYKRMCSFQNRVSQQLDGQNHLITYCIMQIYCLLDLESIFLKMIDWSFKKVGTEIYNDNIPKYCSQDYTFWKHLQIVSPISVSENYSATEVIVTLLFFLNLYLQSVFSDSTWFYILYLLYILLTFFWRQRVCRLPLWRRRVSHPSRRVVRHSPKVIYPQTHNVEVIPVAGPILGFEGCSTLGLDGILELINEL